MTVLCGFLGGEGGADVVAAMGRALRTNPHQTWSSWNVGPLSLGLLELPCEEPLSPAVSRDGRFHLWMAGEAFSGPFDFQPGAGRSRELLQSLLLMGLESIRDLDGEYQIVLWDSVERTLALANDRFGGLPLYWGQSKQGFAFAGGVRGVLMAPGIAIEPDGDALREAMTFGGFRLADRTYVRGVKMMPGASIWTVRDRTVLRRRYWRWKDVAPREAKPIPELVETLDALWKDAVSRRLAGARRPGQTLSGGLDSRAVLAEAAPRSSSWTALTYGVPGCDDALYAKRAAEGVGATWIFHSLYSGRDPDWLERRSSYIQATDGLIELGDLTHLEALPLLVEHVDTNLSGYIGDAVSGPTFNDVRTAENVVLNLPYYGTELGLSFEDAVIRAQEMIADLEGAPPRFALFEHKLPQSTNRWLAAQRPWLRVRKPFIDYAFFDFCQGLPAPVRAEGALHETWLSSRYPRSFRGIPNQKTGLPVLAAPWRVQLERGRRFVWRRIQPVLSDLGVPTRARIRSYRDDERYWRIPDARRRIEGAILRSGSVSADILGRDAVRRVLDDWFDHARAPAQVIGALYVFETYHRDLASHLRAAKPVS